MKNNPKVKKVTRSRALTAVVLLLFGSSIIRLGNVGYAVASESSAAPGSVEELHSASTPIENIDELLVIIQNRTAELDALEESLENRQREIRKAEEGISSSLMELEEAEKSLAEMITIVDGASERDLEQLTTVYQSMTPKKAADILEEMESSFAAGFLSRMSPKAAAEILANMSPGSAHAITVVVAGRHALLPKE